MGMNPTLAAMYNTHGAGEALAEETTKIAHLELFAKAAMAQGINLADLDDGARGALYNEFTSKLAEEGAAPPFPPKAEEDDEDDEDEEEDKEEEKKEAAARQEYAAMSEWTEKNAQADFLGRRMAHAFWDEYSEISKTAAGTPSSNITLAAPKAKKQGVGEGLKAMGKDFGGQASGAAKRLGGAIKAHPGKAALIGGGALAAGGAAAYGAKKLKGKKDDDGEKDASAFDYQAANEGLKIASAAGWDTTEVAARLNAALTLGLGESEKVAQAKGSFEDAVAIRGLEILEQVGYPVDWTQVFGS